jgi:hypothetical protein
MMRYGIGAEREDSFQQAFFQYVPLFKLRYEGRASQQKTQAVLV